MLWGQIVLFFSLFFCCRGFNCVVLSFVGFSGFVFFVLSLFGTGWYIDLVLGFFPTLLLNFSGCCETKQFFMLCCFAVHESFGGSFSLCYVCLGLVGILTWCWAFPLRCCWFFRDVVRPNNSFVLLAFFGRSFHCVVLPFMSLLGSWFPSCWEFFLRAKGWRS